MDIQTPEALEFGIIYHTMDPSSYEYQSIPFIIMPRYSQCLDTFVNNTARIVDESSFILLGAKLLGILEQIHNAGYVYNDLKPNNIMIDLIEGNLDQTFLDNYSVKLIDFGFVTRWREEFSSSHVQPGERPMFQGNIVFSSVDQLNFKVTSRRDDLISLYYLLVFFLNGFRLDGIDPCSREPVEIQIK